jgi:hypothetical protein
MNEHLTDDQIKAILKKEFPKLFDQEIERIAKTCANEKWFIELRRKRLSEDLKTSTGPVIVAANAGGEAKDHRPAVCEGNTAPRNSMTRRQIQKNRIGTARSKPWNGPQSYFSLLSLTGFVTCEHRSPLDY